MPPPAQPQHPGRPPYQPHPQQRMMPQYPMQPAVMKPQRAPWWQREGVVSKLLVVAGGAITLIGVVMLLVIAARAGLLNPQVRVIGGGVLSAVLIAAGLRVHGRPGGSIGGTALAGTGIAGLFIITVAMTSFYEWIPSAAGLALAGGIAAAAGVLAVQWRSELLAVAVTVAVAVLAPVLTGGVTLALVCFLIILQAAGVWPERICNWHFLGLVRTLPAVIAGVLFFTDAQSLTSLTPALAIAGIALASLVISAGADDELHAATFAVAVLPVAAQLSYLDRSIAIVAGGLTAAVLAAVAFLVPQLGIVRRVTVGGVAATLAIESAFAFTEGSWLPVLLLVPGVLVSAVALSTKSAVSTIIGLAFGAIGGAAYLTFAGPAALTFAGRADADLSYATMLGGALLAGWAVLTALALVRTTSQVTPTVAAVGAGIVGLYGATAAFVSFGAAVGGTEGFRSAHLGVTVLWISVAMVLLALGIRLPRYGAATLGAGLLLTGCGVAKLFLFDLQALGGATRAIAFIVVGLVLLFAGSRYAQAYARMRSEGQHSQQSGQPQPPASPMPQH
ncbi:DUF2339 domain-containing protein [Flexivirga sp. B27]